ncbi:MAG: beta-propeller fold lactonase family protein, partial [Gaiellales bacterium]
AGVTAFALGSDGSLTQAFSTVGPAAPTGIAATPDGTFVYVSTGANIEQYAVGSSGDLTDLGPVPAGTAPNDIAVSPDGRFAYVVDTTGQQVIGYTIESDGTLTQFDSAPVATGAGATYITLTASGLNAYVANRNGGLAGGASISQYAINPATGQITPLATPTVGAADDVVQTAVNPAGTYLYATSYNSGRIGTYSIGADGSLTLLPSAYVTLTKAFGVAVSPDGTKVYASSWDAKVLAQYAIGGSGQLASLTPASLTTADYTSDIAINATGTNAYVGSWNSSNVTQFALAAGTGLLTPLSPTTVASGATNPRTIAYVLSAADVTTFTPATLSTNGSAIAYTLNFNRPISNLTANSFTITGAAAAGWSVGSITGSGAGPYTITLNGPSGTSAGTLQLTLKTGGVNDQASRPSPGQKRAATAVTIDQVAPTATWTSPRTPSSATTVNFTLTFSENVNGLSASDFTNSAAGGSAATGCVFTPSATSGTSVTVAATGCSEGVVTPTLAAGAVNDDFGNAGPAAARSATAVTIDRQPARVTTFAPSPALTNSTTATYTLSFSQNVAGLDASYFTIDGASTSTGWTVSSVTPVSTIDSANGNVLASGGYSSGPYTVTLTGTASSPSGTVILKLNANAVANDAAPIQTGPLTAATATTLTYDKTAPSVTSFAPNALFINGSTVTYALQLSEAVIGLTASDLSVGGTATGWGVASVTAAGSPGAYTVTLTTSGTSEGTIIPTLAAASVADLAGNSGPAAASVGTAVTADYTAPIIASFVPAATPTNATSVDYTLTFSEPVVGLTTSDIALAGTSTGWTVASISGSGPYTVTLSGASTPNGTLIPSVNAGAIADQAGTTGPLVAFAGATTTIDRTAPTVASFTRTTSSPSNSGTATYSLTFSESITGLAVGDLTVGGTSAGWAATAVTGTGAGPYALTLTNGSPADGTVTLQLGSGTIADLAGNAGPASNVDAAAALTIDVTPPSSTPAIASGPSGPISTSSASFTFTGAGAGETYVCSVDGGTFAACASPRGLAGLTDGSHTFAVKISDAAGNTTAAAQNSFAVDTVAPTETISIDTKPRDPDNNPTPTFGFSGALTGSQYSCKLDAAGWATCAASYTTATLAEGAHTLSVRAADDAGNVGTTTSYGWVIDRSPPSSVPTILTGPNDPTNQTTGTFTFSGAVGNETYQCRVDGGSWTACTTPFTTATLTDAQHTFGVRLVDPAGNGGTAATTTWNVFTAAPSGTVAVATGPNGPYNATAGTFTFTGAAGTLGYQCRLTSLGVVGSWIACATPKTYGGLVEGAYSLDVRLLDPAGNVGTPTARSFTVDLTAPTGTPTIDTAPPNPDNDATPDVTFSGAAGSDAYECRIDSGAWAACASPFTAPTLAEGSHTFTVRFVDAAGNGGTAASHTWVVDLTAPASAPTLTVTPPNPDNQVTPSLSFVGAGTGDSYQCKVDGGLWTTCTSPRTTATLSEASHTFRVRLMDAAGNAGPDASYTWTVDTTAPSGTPAFASHPNAVDSRTTGTFALIGAGAGETYQCKVDAATWITCPTPFTTGALADGSHTVSLRIADAQGNTTASASWTWTVDTVAPSAAPTLG